MYLDEKEITGIYLGDTEISSAYVGDKEVFSEAPAGPLYAAYNWIGSNYWVYAKYPLNGSTTVYGTSETLKASSSSQLTKQYTGWQITEETAKATSGFQITYTRDTTGDLYT